MFCFSPRNRTFFPLLKCLNTCCLDDFIFMIFFKWSDQVLTWCLLFIWLFISYLNDDLFISYLLLPFDGFSYGYGKIKICIDKKCLLGLFSLSLLFFQFYNKKIKVEACLWWMWFLTFVHKTGRPLSKEYFTQLSLSRSSSVSCILVQTSIVFSMSHDAPLQCHTTAEICVSA